MIDNPQTPDPTPESARALLYRHGLPEDVIDGALCLHAQELAAVQREALTKTDDPVFYGGEAGWLVDLIDPTQGDPQPTVLPAVPVPPATHATDRAYAEAVQYWYDAATERRTERDRLRAVVARVAQMADAWEQRLPEVIRTPAVVSAIRAALEAADDPSRMADEAQQQPDTETPVGYSGKGRVWCVCCPRPAGEDVPVAVDVLQPYEECAGCGRHVVDVARAAQQPASGPGRVADEGRCGPVPDQCDAEAGEPCANHEREQAHAEGEHCFCGPDCEEADRG